MIALSLYHGKMTATMIGASNNHQNRIFLIQRKTLVTSTLIVFILFIHNANSVILPPRFRYFDSDQPLASAKHNEELIHISENIPYLLSINEGSNLDLGIHSDGVITINLNRAVSQDVNVSVSIFSGPDLIELDQIDKNNSSSNSNISAHSQSAYIIYKADQFGDRPVKFHTNDSAGHAEIVCKIVQQPLNITIDDTNSYISINISRSPNLNILIQIVGWIYFFAWSASFYFQVILNYQRQSVVGLNFDFLALNLLGFTCYSIYNFTFLFSYEVQREYYKRYAFSRIPVEYNDLFFALHAFVITLITVIQCFIYQVSTLRYIYIYIYINFICMQTNFYPFRMQRGDQKISTPAGVFLGLCSILGLGLYVTHLFGSITILNVVLYLSYVKLVITVIKYAPQAFMNYQRKATTGWSIHNILLDFTGGIFSITQMFLLAYNYDDWISIFGNFTKFGLGVISMSFDIIFVIQHYVLYKQSDNLDDSTESLPSPVISQSIRSMSQVPAPGRTEDENKNVGE